jgi:PII-like signaling protein
MKGCQLSFYTTLGRKMGSKPLKDWLISAARDAGIPGATVFAGVEGYGHHRRFHSAHFFELTDEPIVVVMVMSEAQKDQLFAKLAELSTEVFYVVQTVEFGSIGSSAGATT